MSHLSTLLALLGIFHVLDENVNRGIFYKDVDLTKLSNRGKETLFRLLTDTGRHHGNVHLISWNWLRNADQAGYDFFHLKITTSKINFL